MNPGLYALVLVFSGGIGPATSIAPTPDVSYSWDACQQAGRASQRQQKYTDYICVPKTNTIMPSEAPPAPSGRDRFYPNG